MSAPVPAFAQEAYAILGGRFGEGEFGPGYLSWFVSKAMVKKTLHVLEKAGWIRRVGKGRYTCVSADSVFRSMLQFRVPGLLERARRPFVYAGASAVEIWTDFSYLQRSWEHSPYFVKVVRHDVDFWVSYFRANRVKVFVDSPEPAWGEFVVLEPQKALSHEQHAGLPVEPLDAVVRFCERHVEAFEYPLAYLMAKHHVSTRVALDPRTVEEAMRA